MKAIYKKELKSYFTSMIGYVYIAVFTVVSGLFFSMYNMAERYPQIGETLISMTMMFMVLVPILTMRSLSEEQKNKTDQLLFTSPVSVPSIVAGKYLALLTVYSIPMFIMCSFPIILQQYGTVDMAQSYLAIFGFFCLGAAYLSIGMFISSLTESQIIAAVLSLIVLLLSSMISGISSFFSNTAMTSFISFSVIIAVLSVVYYWIAKNIYAAGIVFVVAEGVLAGLFIWDPFIFEGTIGQVLRTLDLANSAYNLIRYGILDLTEIVFYISVIGLFLFFTVQTILKKRWN